MAFSFLYLAGRAQLGALIRSRRGPDVKDVELLVLRHITLFVRVSDGLAPRAERHAMNGMSSGAIVTNGRIMSRSPGGACQPLRRRSKKSAFRSM